MRVYVFICVHAQQRYCANLFLQQRAWSAGLSLYVVREKTKDEIETEVETEKHVVGGDKEITTRISGGSYGAGSCRAVARQRGVEVASFRCVREKRIKIIDQ